LFGDPSVSVRTEQAARTNKVHREGWRNGLRRGKVVLGIVAAGVAAFVVLLGGVLARSPVVGPLADARAQAGPADRASLDRLLAGFAAGDTAGLVRRLEDRVADEPGDGDSLAVLGVAYQQRARETGTPTFYSLSARAFTRAAAAEGPLPVIVVGRASLANVRHRFADGLRLARQAIRLDPEDGSAYGALGDALLNLGRYESAFAAYDHMAKLSPGIPSYARVAHARALLGRTSAAVEAYELALESGASVPEYVAWVMVQLGNAHFDRGDIDEAEQAYRGVLERLPGYVHAEAALARVDASRGRHDRAIRRLRQAVRALPVPAYVILLGDVFHASGREAEARRQYALVDVMARLLEAGGVRTELQTALFDLDHDRNLAEALERARAARAAAPSIYADDALAWGLFQNGRCAEARKHSTRALRLGTRDALLFFHRAMIERCLGGASARSWFRRALATNPHFSVLWAPAAREAIAASS
jgi:tetratricopeptide (TPR) repeat protein